MTSGDEARQHSPSDTASQTRRTSVPAFNFARPCQFTVRTHARTHAPASTNDAVRQYETKASKTTPTPVKVTICITFVNTYKLFLPHREHNASLSQRLLIPVSCEPFGTQTQREQRPRRFAVTKAVIIQRQS